MPSMYALFLRLMPFTPLVLRLVGRTSSSLNIMALPALVHKIMRFPSHTRRTFTSSSPSLRLMAISPSRRLLSYSAIAVFFTIPCLVANTKYWLSGKSRVVITAVGCSSSASGSTFTSALPRDVREPTGSSCTLRRYTLPLLVKNST